VARSKPSSRLSPNGLADESGANRKALIQSSSPSERTKPNFSPKIFGSDNVENARVWVLQVNVISNEVDLSNGVQKIARDRMIIDLEQVDTKKGVLVDTVQDICGAGAQQVE